MSELRFADAVDGWAFGPDIYSTHDGTAHWQAETLPAPVTGYAVVSLEAAGGQVFALAVPRTAQSGQAVLLRAPATGGPWQPEPGTAVPGGQRGRVVMHGQAGWLVVTTGQGTTTFLARTGDGWQRRSLPCGSPTDAISAATDVDLAVVCGGGGAAGSQVKDVYLSHDGGSTFSKAGQAPMSGDLDGVAAASATTLVVAAASGASDLHASFDGGHTWSTVYEDTTSGGLPWRDLGFTDPGQGVVIEGSAAPQFAQQPPSHLLLSVDGGRTWARVAF